MPAPSQQQVLAALGQIVDPDLGRDVVSLGMIKELRISDTGDVAFTFELTTPACPVRDRFKGQAEEVVTALPGVSRVDVKMTANVRPGFMRQQASEMLPGVKQTIAVASGKGGVGKSTVAVNLAAALRQAGAKVGLLDADIYGPSVPSLTGVQDQPKVVDEKLIPLRAYGMALMSIGFLGGADGTGDASLTIAQSVPLTGVAIVATPQDLALDIAVKALQMFRSLNVTALGLIENMSWYVCPECGHEHHVFGHGGAERAAQRLGVPFLGAIPLHEDVRVESDAGAPIVVSRPDSPAAKAFRALAEQVAARTSIQSFRQLPVINVR